MNIVEKIFTDAIRCLPVTFLLSFSSFSFWKMIPLVLKKTEVVHKALRVLVARAPVSLDFPQKNMCANDKEVSPIRRGLRNYFLL